MCRPKCDRTSAAGKGGKSHSNRFRAYAKLSSAPVLQVTPISKAGLQVAVYGHENVFFGSGDRLCGTGLKN